MKRNQFYLSVLIFLFVSGCKENRENVFTVDGKVQNATADIIYLEEASLTTAQPVVIDSAKLTSDGSFKMKATSPEENLYILRLGKQPNPVATVINDADRVSVNIDSKNTSQPYTVKGSPATQKLLDYLSYSNTKLSTIYNASVQIDSLRQVGATDSLISVAVHRRNQDAVDYKNYVIDFMNKSKSPSLSVFVLGSYQSYAMNPALGLEPFSQDKLVDMVNITANKFPEHSGVTSLQTSLRGQSASADGFSNKQAPEFTLPDVNGNPVSLSSYKGKYVLVDFWASWCPPCRQENPNLVSAYNQFKNKNFTILGVSLDKEKAPWVKAIKDDNLTWTHVSDLSFWDSKVVPLYNIEGIPYNVLVDPNGVVIAENLRGEELERKLKEVIR